MSEHEERPRPLPARERDRRRAQLLACHRNMVENGKAKGLLILQLINLFPARRKK